MPFELAELSSPEASKKYGNRYVMVYHHVAEAISISICEKEIGPSADGKDVNEMLEEDPRIRCHRPIGGMKMIQGQHRQEYAAPDEIFTDACQNGLCQTPLLVLLLVGCDGMNRIEGDQEHGRHIIECPHV